MFQTLLIYRTKTKDSNTTIIVQKNSAIATIMGQDRIALNIHFDPGFTTDFFFSYNTFIKPHNVSDSPNLQNKN